MRRFDLMTAAICLCCSVVLKWSKDFFKSNTLRKKESLCVAVCVHIPCLFAYVLGDMGGGEGVGVFFLHCGQDNYRPPLQPSHSDMQTESASLPATAPPREKVNSPPPSRRLCWGNKSRWLLGAADLSAKVYSFNRNRNDGPFVDRTSLRTANINYIF